MLKIEVLEDIRCFKKGKIFEFPSHTVLIGNNGSGKSTLLRAIRGYYKYQFKGILDSYEHEWDRSFEDNIKLSKSFKIESDITEAIFVDIVLDDTARQTYSATSLISSGGYWLDKKSHGEASKALLAGILSSKQNISNKLIILDECDTGFDLRSQINFVKAIDNLSKIASQVIITTHSYLFLQQTELPIFLLDVRKFIDKELLDLLINT